MNAHRWLRGSPHAFALAGLLPPFCGLFPAPGEGGHGHWGANAGAAGAVAGAAGASAGGAGAGSGGVAADAGAGGAEVEFEPDPVVGCAALPWPETPTFEVLEGAPARVTGVSANGAVVIGGSSTEKPVASATIWTPARVLLPEKPGLTTQLVEITNCEGDVFAGAQADEGAGSPYTRAFRQTRTTPPVLLATPEEAMSPAFFRVTSLTADGALVLGYTHNGIGNFPLAAVWDAEGNATTPFGIVPHLPIVFSPDGSHIAGRTDCLGSPSCGGVGLFDWSLTEGEFDFIPENTAFAQYRVPVLSHDRTTGAGSPQDEGPDSTLSSVIWFRRGGPTIQIPCLNGGPCQPLAISSHGSVMLLNDHSVWTADGRHRPLPEFLQDAGVELPPGTDVEQITPIALSDDARVIAGYFSGPLGDYPFKLTLSLRAYR